MIATRYLSAEEILILHARVVDETSGSHGIRDVQLLSSIAHKPRSAFGGKELYRGVFKKAAVLLEAIASYHVFYDGNKRTALVVASRFLYLNGYDMTATNRDFERAILAVVLKEMSLDALSRWLKKNSRKIPRRR